MARTILEDFLGEHDSHFELAYNVPRRARDIQRRGNAKVRENNDKPIVVALREVKENKMPTSENPDAY